MLLINTYFNYKNLEFVGYPICCGCRDRFLNGRSVACVTNKDTYWSVFSLSSK